MLNTINSKENIVLENNKKITSNKVEVANEFFWNILKNSQTLEYYLEQKPST